MVSLLFQSDISAAESTTRRSYAANTCCKATAIRSRSGFRAATQAPTLPAVVDYLNPNPLRPWRPLDRFGVIRHFPAIIDRLPLATRHSAFAGALEPTGAECLLRKRRAAALDVHFTMTST